MSFYRRHVIEGQRPGPRLLIMAGVHGDECEPMVAVSQLRAQLDPAKLSGCVMLIPVANESAYRRASRTGEDDLDLARTFPGNPSGSTTERLAAELTEEIRNVDYLIDLHTGGKCLEILPMTGFMLHSDGKVLEKQRQMAEAFDLPIIWGTSAALNGRSLSVARDANIPAIYAEQGGGGRFRPGTVEAYVSGCTKVMAELGMVHRTHFESRVQHRIDDWGSNSGHLQVCHPAPDDGVFLPAVALGERVRTGQELGRVVNLLSGEQAVSTADRDGTVLLLCAASQVTRGTGLCVLVDLDHNQETLR